MSRLSSVPTEALGQFRSIYGSKASTTSSWMSRVSSYLTNHSAVSRLSNDSRLTEVIDGLLLIDEYGFTDKVCSQCSQTMSLEEVLALCLPSSAKEDWAVEFAKKIEEVPMICLSCYAE